MSLLTASCAFVVLSSSKLSLELFILSLSFSAAAYSCWFSFYSLLRCWRVLAVVVVIFALDVPRREEGTKQSDARLFLLHLFIDNSFQTWNLSKYANSNDD